MTTYWFQPKRIGYGATPSTWQGWAFTGAVVVAFSACVELALRNLNFHPLRIKDAVAFGFSILAAVVVVGGCAYVTCRKTEGGCRWRGWR